MQLLARRHPGDVPFIEIVADHGVNPSGGSYAYAILPGMSAEEIRQSAAQPPFTVLANTKEVQAVQYKDGRSAYIFWEKGSFNGISVSAPMLVLICRDKIYVSDPTQKQIFAAVAVGTKEFSFDFSRKYGATLSASL